MPKPSVAEFFIQALADLREEERSGKKDQLHQNIRSYVDKVTLDYLNKFGDTPSRPMMPPRQRAQRNIQLRND
jgi:hypothetical protein